MCFVRIFRVGLSRLAVGGAMFISQPDIIIPLKKRRVLWGRELLDTWWCLVIVSRAFTFVLVYVLILVMLSCPHHSAHTLCCCRLLPNCLFLSNGVESVVGACKPCGLEKRHWFPLLFPLRLRAFMTNFLPPASSKCLFFLNISFHQHDISLQKWT